MEKELEKKEESSDKNFKELSEEDLKIIKIHTEHNEAS
jgi:hypothetical protein